MDAAYRAVGIVGIIIDSKQFSKFMVVDPSSPECNIGVAIDAPYFGWTHGNRYIYYGGQCYLQIMESNRDVPGRADNIDLLIPMYDNRLIDVISEMAHEYINGDEILIALTRDPKDKQMGPQGAQGPTGSTGFSIGSNISMALKKKAKSMFYNGPCGAQGAVGFAGSKP